MGSASFNCTFWALQRRWWRLTPFELGRTLFTRASVIPTASAAHLNACVLQEKYKKKKAKKYLSHVSLIRPCARSLAEFYFQKMPMKIGGLRADTLAILLSLANISAGSRTLVVDGVGGLVAGIPRLSILS